MLPLDLIGHANVPQQITAHVQGIEVSTRRLRAIERGGCHGQPLYASVRLRSAAGPGPRLLLRTGPLQGGVEGQRATQTGLPQISALLITVL
jgi:hypothetical protein